MSRDQFTAELPKWATRAVVALAVFLGVSIFHKMDRNLDATAAIQTDIAVLKEQGKTQRDASDMLTRRVDKNTEAISALSGRVDRLQDDSVSLRWPHRRAESGHP